MHSILTIFLLVVLPWKVQAQPLPFVHLVDAEKLLTQLSDKELDKNPVQVNCQEKEKVSSEDESMLEFEIEPVASFSINHFVGNSYTSQKEFLSSNRAGFQEKWLSLITPKTQEERKAVIADICSSFSQKDAIEFAGFMGSKNSGVYDYDRVSSSGGANVHENIPLDNYYATHRNVEGVNTPGGNLHDRTKMGVCGDAAMMVANFLSQCGFSCEDIDVSGYSTMNSGHKMITARGNNGEFFTANWSEVSSNSNTNPLNLNTADPNIANTGSFMRLHDCNGKAKGSTATPLGTLLMMAHGNDRVINSGQDFTEIKLLAKKLGADEVSISAFEGRDNESTQSIQGLSARVIHSFGKDGSLLSLNLDGSVVLAKANRQISMYDNFDPAVLDQSIVSGRLNARGQVNLNRDKKVKISPFVDADIHGMVSKNNLNNFGSDKTSTSNDGYVVIGSGVSISKQTSDRVNFDTELGVRSTLSQNAAQRGGVDLGSGEEVAAKYVLLPDHLYADAKVFVQDKSGTNGTGVKLKYDNLFLMKRSRINLDAYRKINKTEVGVGYRYLKNPSADGFHGMGLNAKHDFKIKNSLLTVQGGAQYFFVENPVNASYVNLGVIYTLGRSKKRKKKNP